MRALAELRDPVAVAFAAAAALAALWLGHDLIGISIGTLAVLASRVVAGVGLRRLIRPATPPKQVAVPDGHWFAPLTRREADVAVLIRDSTNKEIALRLVLSERTIDNHVANIMNKLNLHHRAQIAAWVTERNRPSLPPKP
jgi:DNA-binding NarL/FixJ family response regulator